jgi:hypothetical protein
VGKYAVIVVTDDHCSIGYVLRSDHPGSHHGYKPYLAELEFRAAHETRLFFTAMKGDPATKEWEIARHASFHQHYAVWRVTGTERQFFGYFRLIVPE